MSTNPKRDVFANLAQVGAALQPQTEWRAAGLPVSREAKG